MAPSSCRFMENKNLWVQGHSGESVLTTPGGKSNEEISVTFVRGDFTAPGKFLCYFQSQSSPNI